MRRRTTPEATPTPKPCGHPLVTMYGKTTYACLWGTSMTFPYPLDAFGTPEGDTIEAAWDEHEQWKVTGNGLQLVTRDELLGPTGEPWAFPTPPWMRD